MHEIEQGFGKPNPNAPAALSRFGFLIGRYECEAKLRLANGECQILRAEWLGRFILDGYVIADEYRMTGPAGELMVLGMNFRTYDAASQTWNMKWVNALGGTWVDLVTEEFGGVTPSKSRSPPTRIRALLIQIFPQTTSHGAVRSLTTARRGANSW